MLSEKPSVLVIGGGIAGIQASLDLSNQGFTVYLVEKSPSIGGRMAQLDKTFPTMDCSICILAPKMIECFRHPNIKLLTYSEVKEVKGAAGNFKVKILKKPRFVDETKCTGCGICSEKCPIKVPNEFEMNLGTKKVIYMPFPQAVPRVATIEKENCLLFQKGVCKICQKLCQAGAVDFDQQPEEITLNVSAIILATGFNPFDPSAMYVYGYRRYKNVITSLEFERLVNASGPTNGKLLRPSDNEPPYRIAFIQCVGSRSQKGVPYCSSACCMYATKEAILIKEHEPTSEVHIFYIDLKVFGKGFQEFVNRAMHEWAVDYIRGRPSEIKENPKTGDLVIWYEDSTDRKVKTMLVNLAVLCTALVPRPDNKELADVLGVELDEYGFFKAKDPLRAPVDATVPGIFMCGYCQGPKDISESVAQASGAAGRAAEVVTSRVAKEVIV